MMQEIGTRTYEKTSFKMLRRSEDSTNRSISGPNRRWSSLSMISKLRGGLYGESRAATNASMISIMTPGRYTLGGSRSISTLNASSSKSLREIPSLSVSAGLSEEWIAEIKTTPAIWVFRDSVGINDSFNMRSKTKHAFSNRLCWMRGQTIFSYAVWRTLSWKWLSENRREMSRMIKSSCFLEAKTPSCY